MKKWRLKPDVLAMTIVLFIVCTVLMCVMFMQFKTVEETDITDIENMREAELRTTLSEWKSKYEETYEQLQDTNKKIEEYNAQMEKNGETSELIDKELEQADVTIGKKDIYGEGVVITLSDNSEYDIIATDLVELINELRYAGAEAISINDIRVINSTEIVDLDNFSYISVGGQRLESPYVVKAIGNQSYLSSILSLKDSGFIDKYTNSGKTVTLETRKRVDILKYNGEMECKYMKDEEE